MTTNTDPSSKRQRLADLLVKAGAAILVIGVVAVLGVMLSDDLDVLDWLLPTALALVPIGFCVAFAGLALLIRDRRT